MVSIDLYHDLKKHDIFLENMKNPERIMVIHGNMDTDVPIADSEEFCGRNHILLHIIEGCDHRYKKPGEIDEVLRVTREFLSV